MRETFESEMDKWEEKLNRALLKAKKLEKNTLSNQSEENKILKEFWKKKMEIHEKYGKTNSAQK